jgi:hypothetical protein
MGAINEAYKKRGQEIEQETARAAGFTESLGAPELRVKNNKTFEQIRSDETTSARFLRFLERNNQEELQESLLVADAHPERLDRATLRKLTEQKENFLVLMEQTDTALRMLDTKTITQLGELFPDLKTILEHGGPQRIKQGLQRKLADMAIQEPARFEAMISSVAGCAEEDNQREAQEKIIQEKFSKEWHISNVDDIARALHGESSENMKSIIRGLAHEKANGELLEETPIWHWRRLLHKGPGEEAVKNAFSEIEMEMQNYGRASAAELKGYENRIDTMRRELGIALEATIMDDKDVHDAVMGAVYGKEIENTETISMRDADKALKLGRADAMKQWEGRLNARRERNKNAFVQLKNEEWLAEQEEVAWHKSLTNQIREQATDILTQEGDDIDDDLIKAKIAELTDKFDNLDPEEKERLRGIWLAEYQPPTPPKELTQEWSSSTPDVTGIEYESLADDFRSEYTERHMENYTKGKKKGYISAAMSGFFKCFLFEDLFKF